ncbi:MAG: hypothetical protein RL719_834, partial [Actinomycetota bacterium]
IKSVREVVLQLKQMTADEIDANKGDVQHLVRPNG